MSFSTNFSRYWLTFIDSTHDRMSLISCSFKNVHQILMSLFAYIQTKIIIFVILETNVLSHFVPCMLVCHNVTSNYNVSYCVLLLTLC